MIGQTISHYRIVDKLGGGGMGVVYKAEDTELGRFVALKFLPDDLARDPQALERFRREARAASALNHPNICTIYEIGEENAKAFLAMEYLEGMTLKHRIAGKPVDTELIGPGDRYCRRSRCRTCQRNRPSRHQARQHLRHQSRPRQDPGFRIGQGRSGRQFVKEDFICEHADRQRPKNEHLTSPGSTLGTVAYMSPEQARAKELDARRDLFSFGAVLYEMATGQLPFRGDSTPTIFEAILNRAPVAPVRLNPDVPPNWKTSSSGRWRKIENCDISAPPKCARICSG